MLEEAQRGRAAPRQACFWSQQSAEKALKAILIHEQIEYPRTHDVNEVLELIPPSWRAVTSELANLGTLSSWAVQARYPDELRDAGQEEAETALAQARAVWDAVSRDFSTRGVTQPPKS